MLKWLAMTSSFCKLPAALDHVVEVHVAELVDLLLAVAGGHERHLQDQHLGLVHRRAVVEPFRRTVAEVGQPRDADLVRSLPSPARRRSRIAAPGSSTYSGFSLRRRSQTTKPIDGTVCRVADTVTTNSRDSSISSPGRAATKLHGSRPRSSRLN